MDCFACELIEDPTKVPGGRIATMGTWVVEHCVGPLGVGTVVVKPLRHVIHVADLDQVETAELGPVLARVTRAVADAASELGDPPGQVYVCLWSHAHRQPGHIHFVVQPVGERLMARHDAHGPELQVRMFHANEPMEEAWLIGAAERIRRHLNASPSADLASDGPRPYLPRTGDGSRRGANRA